MTKLIKLNLFIVFAILASLLAFNFALADITPEEEVEMEIKIKELEEKISAYKANINTNQQKARTLENEIDILDNEIGQIESEIQRINLILITLNSKIARKETDIREIERQVDLEKTALSELIKIISIYDDISLFEVILSRNRFSDFLSEVRSLENFQDRIQITLTEIRVLKENIEEDKYRLGLEKDEQFALKFVQEEQRLSLDSKKTQKDTLLKQTKGQEDLFSQLVEKTEKDVQAIKSRLYFLKGIISEGQLNFGEAYQYAKYASIYTGIRPAFLLAILSRETGLGRNIGTGTWRVDMKPSQQKYYLQICDELGISPDKYPVSKKVWYGWGGAMGPAQFMPSTWLGYKDRVSQITGNNPPSPWNVKDAFVASALYLTNKGATKHDYYSEWKAAMMYLAGSNWNKSYLSFYGDQVMALAAKFQKEINLFDNN
ncbi:MAG: lytic murein transglycosylase [Patescibacteria group bacterium]